MEAPERLGVDALAHIPGTVASSSQEADRVGEVTALRLQPQPAIDGVGQTADPPTARPEDGRIAQDQTSRATTGAAIIPKVVLGVAAGAKLLPLEMLRAGQAVAREEATKSISQPRLQLDPVQRAEVRRRPTNTIQASPRQRSDRRTAVPPGLRPESGLGATLLPMATTNGPPCKSALDTGVPTSEQPSPLVAVAMEQQAADLAKPLLPVVLPGAA